MLVTQSPPNFCCFLYKHSQRASYLMGTRKKSEVFRKCSNWCVFVVVNLIEPGHIWFWVYPNSLKLGLGFKFFWQTFTIKWHGQLQHLSISLAATDDVQSDGAASVARRVGRVPLSPPPLWDGGSHRIIWPDPAEWNEVREGQPVPPPPLQRC